MVETTEQIIKKINSKTTNSVREFNKLIKDHVKKFPEVSFEEVQKRVVFEALKRVVLKTPVDTGKARGNWQVTINRVPKTIVDPPARGEIDILNKAVPVLDKLGFGDTVWISNNVDYMVFLENGHSGQAPKGMVSLTLQELKSIFR